MSAVVRCTPYCNPCGKGYKHHDLLTALLNTTPNSVYDEHSHLAKVVKKYVASGWDKNSVIMDKNEEFRFPMLHWACVLGKPRAVRWLLGKGKYLQKRSLVVWAFLSRERDTKYEAN